MTRIAKCKEIWTCSDGAEVRVCDMADSHLRNARKWVQRQPDEKLSVVGSGWGDCEDWDVEMRPWEKDGWDKSGWLNLFDTEISRREAKL